VQNTFLNTELKGRSWDGVASTTTGLLAARLWVQNMGRKKKIPSKRPQLLASGLEWPVCCRGATCLLPLYAFVAWMLTNFPLLWGNWIFRNVYNTSQTARCYYLENPLLKRRDHNLNRYLCDHLKSHVNFSLISHG